MRIHRLYLKNFRMFEELELELHPQMTVLAGVNKSGKTTVLQAISRALERDLDPEMTLAGRGPAYCLRRLPKDTDDAPAIRIDHVRPRATHPELTFAWSNLVASCLGNTSRKDHCDPAKGERAIPLHPIETLGLEARFEYRGGKIKPAKTGDTDARDAIRLLNLNGNGLVSMRKSVLDELRRRLTPKGGGAFSRRALELQLARVKEDDSFAPMLRQRIKKKLQKKLR